jgi:PAS domain-containing protein
LANNLNTGIYRNSVGPEGRFIEANPAIVKMFGFHNKQEFLESKVSNLYKNPEDRIAYNEKLLRNGQVKNEELQLRKKDGL